MRVVLATGGSGGHLFPALKVAQELRDREDVVYFVGSFGVGVEQVKSHGFAFENLNVKGLSFHNPLEGVYASWIMFKATLKALRLLKKFNPDVVIGFGSYGACPAVFAACLLKVPTLIHEQNVVPGRANALLAKFVNKIAISFDKSMAYFQHEKTVLTGYPCHATKQHGQRSEILEEFCLKEDKVTIFVFGGSQGSHRINAEFIKSAQQLKNKLDFQVLHICGKKDFDTLKVQYERLGVPFALFMFLDRIERAYMIADIIISRAGAGTVTEIASFRLPAILIPYPYAGGHQKENALALCETRLARLIEENDLTADLLTENILDVLDKRNDLKQPNEDLRKIFIPDSAKRLVAQAEALTH